MGWESSTLCLLSALVAAGSVAPVALASHHVDHSTFAEEALWKKRCPKTATHGQHHRDNFVAAESNPLRKSTTATTTTTTTTTTPRLKLKVCTEALCPDCKDFVANELLDAYQRLGSDVIDLELIPFGNGGLDFDELTAKCQHGPGECDANTYQQCAVLKHPDPKDQLPFLACLDSSLPMGYHEDPFPPDLFEACAEEANLPFGPIQACHDDDDTAWLLNVIFFEATPDYHEYVPWVEIEGNPIDLESQSLMAALCEAYQAKGGRIDVCDGEIPAPGSRVTVLDTAPIRAETSSVRSDSDSPPPVHVKVCIEALCPGCKEFLLEQLAPAFEELGTEVIDLELVPFGNAEIDTDGGTVECQHGEGECDANIYEECAIFLNREPTVYLPYITCLDGVLPTGYEEDPLPAEIFERCAEEADVPFGAIKTCHDNPELSWLLQAKFAEATPDDHQYVPWVLINGVILDMERGGKFLDAVCAAYEAGGGLKPPACDSQPVTTNS